MCIAAIRLYPNEWSGRIQSVLYGGIVFGRRLMRTLKIITSKNAYEKYIYI